MPPWACFSAAWNRGCRLYFSPEYFCNDFASFKASMSSTSLWTIRPTVLLCANLVRGLVRQSHGVMRSRKEKKPRSRTRPAVDGREPCTGWCWQLIQNVPEMSCQSFTRQRTHKWPIIVVSNIGGSLERRSSRDRHNEGNKWKYSKRQQGSNTNTKHSMFREPGRA